MCEFNKQLPSVIANTVYETNIDLFNGMVKRFNRADNHKAADYLEILAFSESYDADRVRAWFKKVFKDHEKNNVKIAAWSEEIVCIAWVAANYNGLPAYEYKPKDKLEEVFDNISKSGKDLLSSIEYLDSIGALDYPEIEELLFPDDVYWKYVPEHKRPIRIFTDSESDKGAKLFHYEMYDPKQDFGIFHTERSMFSYYKKPSFHQVLTAFLKNSKLNEQTRGRTKNDAVTEEKKAFTRYLYNKYFRYYPNSPITISRCVNLFPMPNWGIYSVTEQQVRKWLEYTKKQNLP